MPSKPAPQTAALHLGRLARATPGLPLDLPQAAGRLHTLYLTAPFEDTPEERWYVCLSGQLLIDLPHGDFVHLRSQEACRVAAGLSRLLIPAGGRRDPAAPSEATVLLLDV